MKFKLITFHGGGGGGGFTRPIPGDGGADQLRGLPIIGRLPTDGTKGPEVRGYSRIWPDAEGLIQVRMGRMKALYRVHKDSFDGPREAEAMERKARNRL